METSCIQLCLKTTEAYARLNVSVLIGNPSHLKSRSHIKLPQALCYGKKVDLFHTWDLLQDERCNCSGSTLRAGSTKFKKVFPKD